MTKPLIVYLAGPYGANKGFDIVEGNIRAARAIAIKLWEAGHYVIYPHLNTAHFEVDGRRVSDDQYLKGYLKIVTRCDAIVLMPGWEQSDGARAELAAAVSPEVNLALYQWPNMP
jgi:hypothetical protein